MIIKEKILILCAAVYSSLKYDDSRQVEVKFQRKHLKYAKIMFYFSNSTIQNEIDFRNTSNESIPDCILSNSMQWHWMNKSIDSNAAPIFTFDMSSIREQLIHRSAQPECFSYEDNFKYLIFKIRVYLHDFNNRTVYAEDSDWGQIEWKDTVEADELEETNFDRYIIHFLLTVSILFCVLISTIIISFFFLYCLTTHIYVNYVRRLIDISS